MEIEPQTNTYIHLMCNVITNAYPKLNNGLEKNAFAFRSWIINYTTFLCISVVTRICWNCITSFCIISC